MPVRQRLAHSLFVAGATALMTQSAHADTPKDQPFAMRGVELGISLEEFRQTAIPNDGNRYYDMTTRCSSDPAPEVGKVIVDGEDQADGIVDCKWYSRDRLTSLGLEWEHWVDIGTGKGIPSFRFIPVDGQLRLFRVSFFANISYYPGILDALSRGYGSPVNKVEPFKTRAGGNFTSMTSTWDNGLSSITLVERCGHLERYCLTYDHATYAGLYSDLKEKRAAAAASKI